MKSRKGQAAIEYLMNYSWAILAVTVLLVLIFSTGAFNPSQFVMEECYLGPSFSCVAQSTVIPSPPDTKLLVRITNPMGYPIKIEKITFDGEWMPAARVWPLPPNYILNNSQSYTIRSADNFGLGAYSAPGTVRKINFNVTYYICAEEIGGCDSQPRIASGRIVTKIIAP